MGRANGFIAVLLIILFLFSPIRVPENNRMEVSAQTTCADTLPQSEAEISQTENTENTEKIIAIIIIVVVVIIIFAIISESSNEGVAKDWK